MLYIHIPFCKSRCSYCNFFSTTKLELRGRYVEALIEQLRNLQAKTREVRFETIYLGGGTPSVLPEDSLAGLLEECQRLLAEGGEFTIECNPDDVNPRLASLLYNKGVNRVSLGIQTFDDARLRFINRRHTAQKAREAVEILRHGGIDNISIDLMYGFPNETLADWQQDIREALKLNPEHISAYCLTIEEGTALHRLLTSENSENSEYSESSEILLETMYNTLRSTLLHAGYEHYEISNFCKPGRHSRHNSGYWQDKPYLAIGAGAHGYEVKNAENRGQKTEYNGQCSRKRYWNICDVERYIDNVRKGLSVIEGYEETTAERHYNDLITTAMRTSNGLSAGYISECCGEKYAKYFTETAKRLASQGLIETRNTGNNQLNVRLSPDKLFVSDDILAEFIFV